MSQNLDYPQVIHDVYSPQNKENEKKIEFPIGDPEELKNMEFPKLNYSNSFTGQNEIVDSALENGVYGQNDFGGY